MGNIYLSQLKSSKIFGLPQSKKPSLEVGPLRGERKLGQSIHNLCACGEAKDHRSKQCMKCKQKPVSEMTERICTTCKLVKSISEFRIRTRITPKPRSTCKKCESIQKREANLKKPGFTNAVEIRKWEKDNPEKHAKSKIRTKVRRINLLHNLEQIENKLTNQRLCEICNQPPSTNEVLSIDHCHTSGKFRGLICNPCNLALGLFRDNIDTLKNAIEYLSKQ